MSKYIFYLGSCVIYIIFKKKYFEKMLNLGMMQDKFTSKISWLETRVRIYINVDTKIILQS